MQSLEDQPDFLILLMCSDKRLHMLQYTIQGLNYPWPPGLPETFPELVDWIGRNAARARLGVPEVKIIRPHEQSWDRTLEQAAEHDAVCAIIEASCDDPRKEPRIAEAANLLDAQWIDVGILGPNSFYYSDILRHGRWQNMVPRSVADIYPLNQSFVHQLAHFLNRGNQYCADDPRYAEKLEKLLQIYRRK